MKLFMIEPVVALAFGWSIVAQADFATFEKVSASVVVIAAFWYLLTTHTKVVQENTKVVQENSSIAQEVREALKDLRSVIEAQKCGFKDKP